ncbi:hypothetical protein EJB05_14149, partial [Eragrostis curvula]
MQMRKGWNERTGERAEPDTSDGFSAWLDMPAMQDREKRQRVAFNILESIALPTFLSEDVIALQDAPYLKAGILFAPHRSLKGILPANKSSSIVAVVGKEQCCLHTDITFQQLKEIMLPKAIDYFDQNANATVYQMIWKSEHGSAVIFYEKAYMSTVRISMETRRSFARARKRKVSQRKDLEHNRTRMIPDLLQLCSVHMLIRLQSIFIDWMQKEKERQFAAQQLDTPEIPCYVWMIRENREEYI